MEKRKNRFIAFLLGMLTIFLLCLQALPINSATPSPVETVSAVAATSESPENYPRADALFEWEQGAFLRYKTFEGTEEIIEDDVNVLGFSFRVLNPDVFKFNVREESDDWANFEFTVYRTTSDIGAYPVYRLRLLCYEGMMIVGHKRELGEGALIADSTIQDGQIFIGPDQKTNGLDAQTITKTWSAADVENSTLATSEEKSIQLVKEMFEETGYVFDYASVHPKTDQPFFLKEHYGYNVLGVLIRTNSPHSNYFVTANATIKRWEGKEKITGFWLFKEIEKVYDTYESATRSDVRSVKTWLENCNAAGDIENQLIYEHLIERAYTILNNTETKFVDFSYLENIGSSPFARKVTKRIMVPMTDGVLEYHDACNALAVKSLNTLNATVAEIVQDEVDVYHARYLSSARVVAKTEGGYKDEYYLDCNKSFSEYYQQYVDLGAFKAEAFEYAFNEIKLNYKPVLDNYTTDTLYGLWGYVVIPQESTWNHLWTEIFEVPTDVGGACRYYEAKSQISYAQYKKLLEEYGYNWLERLWQYWGSILTEGMTVYANHYLFYADPNFNQVDFGENGDVDSDKGVIENDIQNAATQLVIKVEQAAGTAVEQTNDVLRGVSIAAGAIGAVALVFGCVWLYYKYIAPEKRKAKKRR